MSKILELRTKRNTLWEQTIHIEFREVGILLLLQQQILDDALLDADKPRGQGVHHEVQRLVFNVGEGRPGQIG